MKTQYHAFLHKKVEIQSYFNSFSNRQVSFVNCPDCNGRILGNKKEELLCSCGTILWVEEPRELPLVRKPEKPSYFLGLKNPCAEIPLPGLRQTRILQTEGRWVHLSAGAREMLKKPVKSEWYQRKFDKDSKENPKYTSAADFQLKMWEDEDF